MPSLFTCKHNITIRISRCRIVRFTGTVELNINHRITSMGYQVFFAGSCIIRNKDQCSKVPGLVRNFQTTIINRCRKILNTSHVAFQLI